MTQRVCECCGKALIRKQFPSGRMEAPAVCERRRFCSLACANTRKQSTQKSRRKKVAELPVEPAAEPVIYDSAESYLASVVAGTEPANPARIAVAKALIRFQEPIKRIPKPGPSAKQIARREAQAEDDAVVIEFERKAAEIRAKHAKRMEERRGEN